MSGKKQQNHQVSYMKSVQPKIVCEARILANRFREAHHGVALGQPGPPSADASPSWRI